MYSVFVTEGVVLRKRAVGEASVLVWVLTKELGLVRASGRSARAEASKLRYGLEPLTRARFSFVCGKHEWRLVGVEQVSRSLLCETFSRQRVGKIAKLLLRLIHGEEFNRELYDTAVEGFEMLARTQPHDAAESVEAVLVLRILSHLGYLPHTDALAPFIEGGYSLELGARALRSRALLVRTINESLAASGL